MPMIVLPLYDATGIALDDAHARALDMVAEAFGIPVTHYASLAAHSHEAGCLEAVPAVAIEFSAGADAFATRATVLTIARRFAADTGCARVLYFRESGAAEVMELAPPTRSLRHVA